jgi:hypothetical protein
MKRYRMGCCDCGLVHELDFRVVRVVKKRRDGSMETEPVSAKEFRIEFRARRNEKSTSQLRRNKRYSA